MCQRERARGTQREKYTEDEEGETIYTGKGNKRNKRSKERKKKRKGEREKENQGEKERKTYSLRLQKGRVRHEPFQQTPQTLNQNNSVFGNSGVVGLTLVEGREVSHRGVNEAAKDILNEALTAWRGGGGGGKGAFVLEVEFI